MPFGLKGAPAHFQKALQLTVQAERDLTIIVYIDDIVASATSWEDLWKKTLLIIEKLSKAGFMLNLNKCKFLTTALEVVGMEVIQGAYAAKKGKISALIASRIPKT